MSIGSTILTNLGQNALAESIVTDPINITSFTVSNTSTPLDPTLTNFTGWITKIVTSVSIINNNEFEIVCTVEPDEAVDQMASVGVFLDDGTLFMISNPVSPIPPGVKQTIKMQLSYDNCSSLINFDYIPWQLERETLAVLDTQVSMMNNVWSLSSKNQIYDTLKTDYYTHKNSYTSARDIYINPIGRNYYFYGTDNILYTNNLDDAIDKNRSYSTCNYNLFDISTTNINGYTFMNRSHDLYDNDITIQPYTYTNLSTEYVYISGTNSTPISNWKVSSNMYPLYGNAYNIVNDINRYITEFSYPIIVNNNSISITSGSTTGYWIAYIPLANYSSVNTLNLTVSGSSTFQVFTYDRINNAQFVFQSPNFNPNNSVFTTPTSGSDTGSNFNLSINITPITEYLIFIVWSPSGSTYLNVVDNSPVKYTSSPLVNLITYPYTQSKINHLYLNGNCNITFSNLNMDFSRISLNLVDSIIKGHTNSDSTITLINCNLSLNNNLSFISSEWYNDTRYFSKVNVKIINSNIYTNHGYLVTTSRLSPDILIVNSYIDNPNNLVYTSI